MFAILSTLLFAAAACAAGTTIWVTLRTYGPDARELGALVRRYKIERFVTWRVISAPPFDAMAKAFDLTDDVRAVMGAERARLLRLGWHAPAPQSLAA